MNYRPGYPVVKVKQQVNLPTRSFQRQIPQPQPQQMRRIVRQENVVQTRIVNNAVPQSVSKVVTSTPRRPGIRRSMRPQQLPKPLQKKIAYKTADISLEHVNKIRKLKDSKKGKILVVVANGPSIMEVRLQDLKNRPDLEMVMINKPDDRIWPTDHWAFFDVSQIRRHADYWNYYEGTLFNSTAIKQEKSNTIKFKNIGGMGFSKELDNGLHIGRSSVYAVMQIALWMNYDKVYIFGCDMNPAGIDGKLHFYGTNPDVAPDIRKDRFKNEAQYYSEAANKMTVEERNKFYFCSSYNKWDFISKYRYLDHKEAISHILEE